MFLCFGSPVKAGEVVFTPKDTGRAAAGESWDEFIESLPEDAAEAAGIAVLVPFTVFSVSCSYGDYQKLTRLVPLFGVREEQTVYETGVTVSGSLPSEKRDAFAAAVTEATSGGVSVLFSGERFDRVPESI